MSRKYLNEKYCVRCGRCGPTPYLKKNVDLLLEGKKKVLVADIGCGNLRNTAFMQEHGCLVRSFDMAGDFGETLTLGKDHIPMSDGSADVILANYVFMFLNAKERKQLISEIRRIGSVGCMLIVELYAAKDSEAKTKEEIQKMQEEIFRALKWSKIRYSQERFIVQKV